MLTNIIFVLAGVIILAAALVGVFAGYFIRKFVSQQQHGSIESMVKQKLDTAHEKADRIIRKAEEQADKLQEASKGTMREREARLDQAADRFEKREERLDEREMQISKKAEQLEQDEIEVESLKREQLAALLKIGNLSEDEAMRKLTEDLEEAHGEALLARIQKLEATSRERLDEKARELLLTAIHRIGSRVNAEVMTMPVRIPSEEMKAKIIGKEGRNIKAFERATGVDLLIDEAPDRIILSSFDPLRRYVAKVALEGLFEDGRIQLAKIEETVEKARRDVETIAKQKGEEAAYEASVVGLDPKLVALLGRLHFRSSYGQNVLQHSVEMAHIAGLLAEELGADPDVARAGALLHDIGKAVDHEVQGTHVEIGRRILEKFGVGKPVIQAMQSHHEEFPYETPESMIVQVADAISAGRPGARRDTVERYLERLDDLERLAAGFPGVEKAHVISAGREIRIFVNPGKVSDIATHRLAASIAGRIQEELKYPGEIKVNVIRENRVVEFAR